MVIVDVLVMCMEWNITGSRLVVPESHLQKVHQAAVGLLESPKTHLPDKFGDVPGCNFEKADSILHKVSKIDLWGKTVSVAHLTNNKDVSICRTLQFHYELSVCSNTSAFCTN